MCLHFKNFTNWFLIASPKNLLRYNCPQLQPLVDDMAQQIIIKFCEPCGFARQAEMIAEEIRGQYAGQIDSVELLPTDRIGTFEISVNGELIFSKNKAGRMPYPGEINQALIRKMANKK